MTPPPSPPAPVAHIARPSVERIIIPGGSASTKIEVMLDTKAGNWACWSRLMNYLFAAVKVKNIVYGQIICLDPLRDPDGTRNWTYNNNYAQMLITTNISESLMVHTEGCLTRNNMWKTLRAMFEATTELEYTEHLRTIFKNRATDNTNILDHLMKLKSTWNKIHIHSNPRSMEADTLFKRVIAATLPRSWDHFTKPYVQGCINQMDRDPNKHMDSQSLIGLIQREYESNESQKSKEASNGKDKNGFHNTNANRNSNNGRSSNGCNNRNTNSNSHDHCNHCGKDGHKTRDCRYLDKPKCDECGKFSHKTNNCWEKPGNKRPRGRENSNFNGSNKCAKCKANNVEANNTGNAKDADKTAEANIVVCGTNETADDKIVVIQGEVKAMNAEEEIVNAADGQADNSKVEYSDKTKLYNEDGVLAYDWLADSGTTSHITYRRDAFITYELIKAIPIKGVGGMKAFAVRKGTVILNSKCNGKIYTIELRDVLHIPSNRNSLFAAGNWEQCRQYFLGRYLKFTLFMNKDIAIARGDKLSNSLYQI